MIKLISDLIYVFVMYVILSFMLWGIRSSSHDGCKKKYMDYVFPLTILHCDRGGNFGN